MLDNVLMLDNVHMLDGSVHGLDGVHMLERREQTIIKENAI